MTRLAPVAFGPVCAREYPTSPDGDGGLVCPTRIAHEHTSSAWDIWQAVSGRSVRGAAELRFPHAHLCLEAATSGLGVALIDQRLIRDELAEGRLVAPCGFAPFPDGFVVLAASERASSPSARAFVAWLGEALESGD
jgi:DNA-binding transcriptional LysR family regulator